MAWYGMAWQPNEKNQPTASRNSPARAPDKTRLLSERQLPCAVCGAVLLRTAGHLQRSTSARGAGAQTDAGVARRGEVRRGHIAGLRRADFGSRAEVWGPQGPAANGGTVMAASPGGRPRYSDSNAPLAGPTVGVTKLPSGFAAHSDKR
ncbi:hypothetical protein EsH8_VIII_000268 [Colletotrichum jinshuiense]